MKKGVLTSLLVLVTFFAWSQVLFKGGVAITRMAFDYDNPAVYFGNEVKSMDVNHRVGGEFGIGYNWEFSPLVAFEPGLFWARQGTKADLYGVSSVAQYDLTIDYLKLPLLIHVRPGTNQVAIPSVYAGPYVARNLNSEGKIRYDEGWENTNLDLVKPWDTGMVLGVSWTYPMNRGAWLLDFRANLGMINVANPNPEYNAADYGAAGDVRNLSFSLLGGYRF